MSILKNWKGLYKTEQNNRKLYEQRYKTIYDENIKYQKTIKELINDIEIFMDGEDKFDDMTVLVVNNYINKKEWMEGYYPSNCFNLAFSSSSLTLSASTILAGALET